MSADKKPKVRDTDRDARYQWAEDDDLEVVSLGEGETINLDEED